MWCRGTVGGNELPLPFDFRKCVRGDDGLGDSLTAHECVIGFCIVSDRCFPINSNSNLGQKVSPRDDAKVEHERRRDYRLAAAGRNLAIAEANRLADVLRLARRRKILRGSHV